MEELIYNLLYGSYRGSSSSSVNYENHKVFHYELRIDNKKYEPKSTDFGYVLTFETNPRESTAQKFSISYEKLRRIGFGSYLDSMSYFQDQAQERQVGKRQKLDLNLDKFPCHEKYILEMLMFFADHQKIVLDNLESALKFYALLDFYIDHSFIDTETFFRYIVNHCRYHSQYDMTIFDSLLVMFDNEFVRNLKVMVLMYDDYDLLQKEKTYVAKHYVPGLFGNDDETNLTLHSQLNMFDDVKNIVLENLSQNSVDMLMSNVKADKLISFNITGYQLTDFKRFTNIQDLTLSNFEAEIDYFYECASITTMKSLSFETIIFYGEKRQYNNKNLITLKLADCSFKECHPNLNDFESLEELYYHTIVPHNMSIIISIETLVKLDVAGEFESDDSNHGHWTLEVPSLEYLTAKSIGLSIPSAPINLKSFHVYNLYGEFEDLLYYFKMEELSIGLMDDEFLTASIGGVSESLKRLNVRFSRIGMLSSNVFQNLEYLDLMGCTIDWTMFSEVSLTNMKSLNLCATHMRTIPNFVLNCKLLEMLDLTMNHLRHLPKNFSTNLHNLKELHLEYITFQNDFLFPESLEFLDLKTCDFRGLSHFKGLLNLSRIILRGDVHIPDLLPEDASSHESTQGGIEGWETGEESSSGEEDMNEDDQITTTSVINNIWNLPNLRDVDISKRFHNFPAHLQINKVFKLNLSSSEEKHPVFVNVDWYNFIQLEELNLSSCKLFAFPEIYLSKSLKILNVSKNYITNIDQKIKHVKFLEELNVSHNNINVLPNEIGELYGLQQLNLSLNMLEILPDIKALKRLRELHIEFQYNVQRLPTRLTRSDPTRRTIQIHRNHLPNNTGLYIYGGKIIN